MRVVILTSAEYGTAAHHLPSLVESDRIEIAGVILNRGEVKNKRRYYWRKLKKIWKIGLAGTINGIRMRSWFSTDVQQILGVDSICDQCKKYGVPLFETDSINNEKTESLMRDAQAEVGLSLGNGFIAPRIFQIPKYGMINIHHEVLPDFQNAQSVIWQIYHGSKNTGFTIHQIERKIDAGAILYQEHIPIVFKADLRETVSHTVAALWKKSAEGLVRLLENFSEYSSKATMQGKGKTYTTPSYRQFLTIRRQHERLKNG